MLRELYIEDFALIHRLTVGLGDGLNILTGETGAGKSIIIDALNQVLGERASSDLIRSGAGKAVVSAVFDLSATDRKRLAKLGIDHGEGAILLQRELFSGGKSSARINGRPVTVGQLRQAAALLVEIHGQHEHQLLSDAKAHRQLLDGYGGQAVLDKLAAYRAKWEQLSALKEEQSSLHGDKRERERLLDLLQFQIDEIEAAKLEPAEEEKLLSQRKLLQNAQRLIAACSQGYETLYQGEGTAVVQVLGEIIDALRPFKEIDGVIEQACSQLEDSLYNVEDAARQLRGFADGFEFDPNRLEEIEKRLDLINDFKRKYADTIQGILDWQAEKQTEVERIKNSEARHAQLSEEIKAVAAETGQLAMELSALRKAAAKQLARAVEGELAFLEMRGTRFEVEFAVEEDPAGIPWHQGTVSAGPDGADRLQFLLSPNPGEPVKPLDKIASGGEMSRIMLAILNVLAELQPVDTAIFDEIDAGIGGRAAQAVAEKLSQVAKKRQVVCVSHLPQVSSMADHHFLIFKERDGERTVTRVKRLDMDARVEELARMLGGAKVTDATRSHAGEMLRLASQIKAKFGFQD